MRTAAPCHGLVDVHGVVRREVVPYHDAMVVGVVAGDLDRPHNRICLDVPENVVAEVTKKFIVVPTDLTQ